MLGVHGVGVKKSPTSARVIMTKGALEEPSRMAEPPSSISVYTPPSVTPPFLNSPNASASREGVLESLRLDAAPMRLGTPRPVTVSGTDDACDVGNDASTSGSEPPLTLRKNRSLEQTSQMRGVLNTPHVRQTHSWDCGLACVLMVLRALTCPGHGGGGNGGGTRGGYEASNGDGLIGGGLDGVSNRHRHPRKTPKPIPRSHKVHKATLGTMRTMCSTQSVWTVDLAHLLSEFNVVDVVFYTITIGANPEFKDQTFYKETLGDDSSRVNSLFQTAGANGILVEKREVAIADIKAWSASGTWLLIVLVDKRKLHVKRHRDESEKETNVVFGGSELRSSLPEADEVTSTGTAYTGHYVVVMGYDDTTGTFELRDPAVSLQKSIVRSVDLDLARRSFGTDQDLLLVRRQLAA
jgi:hypothetical protein